MEPLQRTLLGAGEPAVDPTAAFERIPLDDTSWVDVSRGWLHGADTVLEELVGTVPWRQGRRRMYDRMVDDPRLSRWYRASDPLPHPALDAVRAALARRYRVRFGGVGLNYYRDGRDSVAFHRDRELRHLDRTLVAIVTLGAARPFLVRPHGGGRSRDLRPGSGDLLVMGGRCQADWEHGVPKVASAGPRISASWRWSSGTGPGGHPSPARTPRRGRARPSWATEATCRPEASNTRAIAMPRAFATP
ncbi:MAG: alpha-ketoglutarate-dependent dioxygenase AlkB [Acidimicrobiia bacterium]|nr:alpha-ketoglutarate-dependent dioxygenase AlkB [Acidimicrobiia bacterium]